jgi:uncharacterized protein (TIGR02145 family)
MKKLIFLLILCAPLAFHQKLEAQAPRYEINGSIEGAEGVKFILQKNISGKLTSLDSTTIVNGQFKITGGSVDYPEMVFLAAIGKMGGGLSFFLENSSITISGKLDSLSEARVTGSKSQDEFLTFQKSMKLLSDKMTKLSNEYRAANDALMDDMKSVGKDFIKNNSGSFVTPMILSSMSGVMKPGEMEAMINSLDPEVAKSPLIRDLKMRMTGMKTVVIGNKAPDFILNDPKGKQVSLNSKIGPKLLLIDFWAGWCAPCRQENPNVLKVYKEFRKKGLDIIGVSLDRDKDQWMKAIAADKLPWTQVSDLKYFDNEAAKLYNINSIPANFLLNEKGIIVAVNLRGEALYNKIKKTLDPGKAYELSVTDIDGNVYNTVTIGKQVWMTENLKTTRYRNGDLIPNVKDSVHWKNLTSGAYCHYNNDAGIAKTYGNLYNGYAVNDPRGIAPKGWHVASEAEWTSLVNYLGGGPVAAGKLRESDTTHWSNPNYGANNESGFTALPGGYLNATSHAFLDLGKKSSFHTATEKDNANIWHYIINNMGYINKGYYSKLHGRSVRCVKD